MNSTYSKIKLWIKRYGPWEFRGTLGAMAWGYIASLLTQNNVAIWYAWAWWENVWYYGYFLWREKKDQRVLYNQKASMRTLGKNLLSEFGAWELLDSFVIRPFTMWRWAKIWDARWLLAGKLAADIIFYISATVLYYRKTKRNVDERLQVLSAKIYGNSRA